MKKQKVIGGVVFLAIASGVILYSCSKETPAPVDQVIDHSRQALFTAGGTNLVNCATCAEEDWHTHNCPNPPCASNEGCAKIRKGGTDEISFKCTDIPGVSPGVMGTFVGAIAMNASQVGFSTYTCVRTINGSNTTLAINAPNPMTASQMDFTFVDDGLSPTWYNDIVIYSFDFYDSFGNLLFSENLSNQ